MFLRSNEWVFIHQSQWDKFHWITVDEKGNEKYFHKFELQNLKRIKALKMGKTMVTFKTIKRKWETIPNPYYMPEIHHCYSLENGWYKVPNWITWELHDHFISTYDSQVVNQPPLKRNSYDYQENSINELLSRGSVWLLHASTWSGKTQMISDILVRLKRNTLIVVQNLTQMAQMVDDITGILGVIPTQVSGKKSSKKEIATWYPHITVCSIDSRDKINPHDYGLILLDEADTYLGSDDRREWVGNLSPEYMYALTGTVKVNDVDDNVFEMYYWPTTRLELLHLTPHYVKVLSQFTYKLQDLKLFHELKAALYSDEERNNLIVETVLCNENGSKGLVFTEHIEHAHLIGEALRSRGVKAYVITGEIPKDERERIRQEVISFSGTAVIVWSVKIIGRWFDLPELSFAVFTTAEKFESNLDQYIWRIIRKFEWKPQAVFYDITDHLQYLLKKQSIMRAKNFKKKFPNGRTFIKS